MKRHRGSRGASWLLIAALPLLLAIRCDVSYTTDESPGPPPVAFVFIDSTGPRVDTASISLQGQAECPGCFASDWQAGSCPVIDCPVATGDVWWTNHATGASGSATHGIFPACNCPIFSYGYCYSACRHVWWATVPLTFGNNDIDVFATAPGYAAGSDSVLVERVPLAPVWLPAQPGAGTMQLAWTAVAGATSYNLYWSTTPYGWSSLMTQIAGVSSPFTQVGLASGVEHYWYVTALVGDAESFDSQRLAATPN